MRTIANAALSINFNTASDVNFTTDQEDDDYLTDQEGDDYLDDTEDDDYFTDQEDSDVEDAVPDALETTRDSTEHQRLRGEVTESRICSKCISRPAAPGYKVCEKCRGYTKSWNREKATEARDGEYCIICNRNKAAPRKRSCETCLAMRREYREMRAGKLRKPPAKGVICYKCKGPPTPGFKSCEECRVRVRDRRRLRRQAASKRERCGACITGKASPGKNYCDRCLAANVSRLRRKRDECVAKGVCHRCRTRPLVARFKTCAQCRDRERVAKTIERRRIAEVKQELSEQKLEEEPSEVMINHRARISIADLLNPMHADDGVNGYCDKS